MFSSSTVANRFIQLAADSGKSLTPMQLLKLVYLAHGWKLGLYGEPLTRDTIEAWQYGPVIPELYREMRGYRSRPVTQLLFAPAEVIDERSENVIGQVYNVYGHLTGPALSRLTHLPGSPWAETYISGSFGIEIPDDLIEDYFRRKAAAANPAPP